MTTSAIRQKLHEYIQIADDKKVRAIFNLVENDINRFDWENNPQFMAELERRSAELQDGTVVGVSWGEAMNSILDTRKSKA